MRTRPRFFGTLCSLKNWHGRPKKASLLGLLAKIKCSTRHFWRLIFGSVYFANFGGFLLDFSIKLFYQSVPNILLVILVVIW